MEPACIRHTDLPGTSKLFADFSYHFDRVARFYRYNPHDPASLAAAAREVSYPEPRRAALTEALKAQNGDSETLRRFGQPGTLAVVTGQQVGLFGGPAYTIYKALTAAHLARNLSSQGVPAVPIFWLASEDHDFAEVSVAWSFDSAQKPVRLEVEAPEDAKGRARPVGNIALPNPPLEELRQSLAGFPFASEVMAAVEQAYVPGTTMVQGFRALIRKILEPLGMLMLDPLDSSVRAVSAPFIAEALSAAPELRARLLERNQELTDTGYHAQVLVDSKTSLFFLLEGGERVPQRLKDSEFGSLRGRAADVSPNALLRPVMQDYLLPTVAYVGGPAEVAYMAQSRVIYDRLLGRMPVIEPRCGFTLLDARADKLMTRYGLSLLDTLTPEESLKDRIGRALVPDSVDRAFDDAATHVERELDRLGEELDRFDHTLAASLLKSRGRMLYQLQKVRWKTARESMRRDVRAASDAQHLSGLLFPHRHLQERFYSILPFLAQHGFDLVDQLYDAVELSCPDHRVLTL
jgi:bacillithiol biosynthesis cysteine-adding enzyme BshC